MAKLITTTDPSHVGNRRLVFSFGDFLTAWSTTTNTMAVGQGVLNHLGTELGDCLVTGDGSREAQFMESEQAGQGSGAPDKPAGNSSSKQQIITPPRLKWGAEKAHGLSIQVKKFKDDRRKRSNVETGQPYWLSAEERQAQDADDQE